MIGEAKPEFKYKGMDNLSDPIRFGMAFPEIAEALPMLPQELVGPSASYDVNTSLHIFQLDACQVCEN